MKQWRCTICGYIHEGSEPSDACPVCKAPKTQFILVEALGHDLEGHLKEAFSGESKASADVDEGSPWSALTASDIGIAVGTATDAAIEASHITLVRNDLLFMTGAVPLSSQTYGSSSKT